MGLSPQNLIEPGVPQPAGQGERLVPCSVTEPSLIRKYKPEVPAFGAFVGVGWGVVGGGAPPGGRLLGGGGPCAG